MSTKSSAAPIMAWNWVIQSLAQFNQVDSSTLVGLVKKVPDDLGKDAREMVSLLILESLFIPGNEDTVDTDSAQSSKISLDPSEHCEDVLHKILEETSELVTEVKHTKCNVRPFIMHKRSSLPKSPLQKLKEALLEGSHPLLVSLKERSNLGVANTSETTNPVADVSHPLLVSLKERSNLGVANTSEKTSPVTNVDFGAQTTVAKDDLLSPNPAKKKNKLQENMLQESNDEENATTGFTEHDGRKEHEVSIDPPEKSLDKNTCMNQDDNVPKDMFSEGQVKTMSTDRIKHLEFGECRDPKNHILPNAFNGGPSGEGKSSKENGSQLKTGTDKEISDDEWTDVAAKKEAFLSSTLGQDFMSMNDYTELCLCVKCNKGGQLLVCSSDACPIRVHESCLCSAPALDENGIFSCPFCAYSRAISKFQEVQRRASLARIDLQSFLSSQVKYTRKRACVRNEENPMLAEPSRLHVDNELPCGDKEVSVGDPRSTAAGDVGKKVGDASGDVGKKVGDASGSPTTDSLHQPIQQPRMRRRQFDQKESYVSPVASRAGRLIKRKPQYTSPPLPLIGRKSHPWTKSEEEILKEGVQRFWSGDKKGMPWKEILEFGRDVFQKSRTPIDLKDKWRNLSGKSCGGTKKPKL